MNRLTYILNFLTGVILIALAIDYLAKDLRTFWLIFLLLGLDRIDIGKLYLKINNGGNRNENKKS